MNAWHVIAKKFAGVKGPFAMHPRKCAVQRAKLLTYAVLYPAKRQPCAGIVNLCGA